LRYDNVFQRSNIITISVVTLALFIMLMSVTFVPADPSGTRAGEIGWQYEVFDDNIEMTITPDEPTTDQDILIEIVSKVPGVDIQIANLYATVQPDGGLEFPYQSVFQRWNDSALRVSLSPFPYDGYRITLWIVAYDWFNSPMDSRESFNNIFFDVTGSGWVHAGFDSNVGLSYHPMTVNASEEVTVTIVSNENITFGGANLWWTYETPDGERVTGVGRNFSKKNSNMTEMSEAIMGYPAGTNVTFWVQVWDSYNDVLVSIEYNYSVLGVLEYADFPFEYVTVDADGNFDRSEWTPTYQILIPLIIVCALGVPLFLYLNLITERRELRNQKLVLSNGMDDGVESEKEDEAESDER
jgi:hypothetical protein